MASGDDPCPEYHERTRRSGFRYCFYVAHHGRGAPDDTQWADDVGRDEEFAIFDVADWHEFSDSNGNFYGIRRSPEGMILDLGAGGEQIAFIWRPRNLNQPTHGFPLWPLGDDTSDNRKQTTAPKAALRSMEQVGLLSTEQRKKLDKGKHAR
jgi:hypothetical protein